MRSYAVTLEAIGEWSALRRAWQRYRRGKRRRPEVAFFEIDADRSLLSLSRSILDGSYRHAPYRLTRITDPKPRLIAVAAVRDRIVHSALYEALSGYFLPGYIDDSYACIPKRGTHRATLRFLEFQRRNAYRMHLDIRSFFPSVDHELLRAILFPRLRAKPVRQLLDQVLASARKLYAQPEVRTFYQLDAIVPGNRPQGLPIGNLTSQWWGNQYLDGLDQYVKRQLKVKDYLRYMDDMVFFGNHRDQLHAWRQQVALWLWEQRRLRIHLERAQIQACSGATTFLGYRISRSGMSPGRKMRQRFRKSLRRHVLGDAGRLRQVLISWRGLFY